MKKLQDFNFNKKKVLVRCDFNVPVSEKGEVLDDFRIKMALPTIQYLIKKKAKVVLMSHFETRESKPTLKVILPRLEQMLKTKIQFLPDFLNQGARDSIEAMEPGQVALLENLRFYKGEKENDQDFAKKLAQLGDIFVNEAFSVCHRKHASVASLPQYLPKAAGLLLEKEIKIFSDLLAKPERPFVAIIGGIKIETKIKTILNILEIADHVILGSKIGEAILSQRGIIVGRDFSEEKLIDKIDLTNPKIHLPLDGVIALKDPKDNYLRKGGVGTLRKEEDIFDIGPESIKVFKNIISQAKTILWNGTLGMHEDKKFREGTHQVADAITRNHSAFKIAGGGETVSAIDLFGLEKRFDFLSTGGGAMLEFLAGEKLPGIEALENN